MGKLYMRSIRQAREMNSEYTRLKPKHWCKGCSGCEGCGGDGTKPGQPGLGGGLNCPNTLIFIPAGTQYKQIPREQWSEEDCGIPQLAFIEADPANTFQMTWSFDSLPEPTRLILNFGSPTTFDLYVQLTF